MVGPLRRAVKSTALMAIVVALVVGCGGDAEQDGRSRAPSSHDTLSTEQSRELERIATLGYVDGVAAPTGESGVTFLRRDAVEPGYTLFSSTDGPYALLIDMDGAVLHSWYHPGSSYWSRVRVLENGDLLAVTIKPPQLLCLDARSRLLWSFSGHAHHDVVTTEEGLVLALVRRLVTRSYLNDGEQVIDDGVLLLNRDGKQLAYVSLLEAFENSEIGEEQLAERLASDGADIFHVNSLEVLPMEENLQVLLSIRSLGTVAVLDLPNKKIVWALSGRWSMQHEAQLVDGHLLLFDNLGLARQEPPREQSRVIEIDLATDEIVWTYTAGDFFTRGEGAQQRLPNGNTLITESEQGRIIEVTRSGEIVWEYVNPATIDSDTLVVAKIPRAERVPAGFPKWDFMGDVRRRAGTAASSGVTSRN